MLILLTISSYISEIYNPPAKNISYGVSFSPTFAEYLDLDWKKTYLAVLDDLQIKHLRIPTYWTSVEKNQGKFDFTDDDFMLEEAQKRGVKVVVVLGIKQPRWPECHVPQWAQKLSINDRHEAALKYIKETVNRYKDNSAVYAWQIENEPFFYPYGDCPVPDLDFFKKEVTLVKGMDKRPVIVSETGEWAPWIVQMQSSDIFGTTLYRDVYHFLTGYFTYPLTPGYYSLRSNFFRKFFAPNNQKTIIVELQAEPWFANNSPLSTPVDRQIEIFSEEKLEANLAFAKKTGFDEIYLWGVEWWYFMKEKKGHPEYWDYVKNLFN